MTRRRESALDRARREQAERNGRAGKPMPAEAKPRPAERLPDGLRGDADDAVREGDAGAEKAPKRQVRALLRTASAIESRPVEWLWPAHIPRGAVTLIDGDPGLGKSTVAVDVAARVSRGWAMPPEPGGVQVTEPADVILLSAEDDAEKTIRPRLDAAGADTDRVHLLDSVGTGDDGGEGDRPPTLPLDLDLIEAAIREKRAGLVVIDPAMAYLGGEVDAHKDADVRRVLHRLKLLAERTGAAIVIIRHLNKLIGGPAMYRGGGSIGIVGAVRSALAVGRDPQNADRCVLAPVKCNLCRMPPALAYSHEPVGDVSRIGWIGECDLTADDILAHGGSRRPTEVERCADAIKDLLAGKSIESNELNRLLGGMGYSDATIQRARRRVGVRPKRVGFGAEGQWMASLPAPPEEGIPD